MAAPIDTLIQALGRAMEAGAAYAGGPTLGQTGNVPVYGDDGHQVGYVEINSLAGPPGCDEPATFEDIREPV